MNSDTEDTVNASSLRVKLLAAQLEDVKLEGGINIAPSSAVSSDQVWLS